MKKLLIGTAAVALGLSMAAPAQADGVTLDVGGHFKGYGAFVDQDEAAGTDVREFDFLRETELHFTGETTLDNGLTVGAHIEVDLNEDGAATGTDSDITREEAYAYFSGAWGRINLGEEDGAAYLLQVAAPSADSNFDGIRAEYMQPVNLGALSAGATFPARALDYDQNVTDRDTKLTYITPVFSGFQAGVSYTPQVANNTNGLDGVNTDDDAGELGDAFDLGVRWEGQFEELGVALGAGYTTADQEVDTVTNDDRDAWNVGADFDWGPFGLGAIYKEDNAGLDGGDDEEVFVVGLDYTTGPFKLGASYFNADNLYGTADLEAERWSGGVVYTYGPGMTFRGSVQFVEYDGLTNIGATAGDDADATSVLVGTQINF